MNMALCSNTPIPTPNKWYLAKEIKPGQLVFNRFGFAVKVISVQTYTPAKMYRVTFDDGSSIDVDHRLEFDVTNEIRRRRYSVYRSYGKNRRHHMMNCEKILEIGVLGRRGRKEFTVMQPAPVHFYTEDHPVPPFIVGMWSLYRPKTNSFAICAEFKDFVKEKLQSVGWKTKPLPKNRVTLQKSINQEFLLRYPTIPIGIPEDYMFGSVEQRIDLLSGILAVRPKSINPKNGMISITSTDKRFALLVQGVCESLGIRTNYLHRSKNFGKPNGDYQIDFKTDIPLVPTVNTECRGLIRNKHRIIASIEEIEPRQCTYLHTEEPIIAGEFYHTVWH